MNSHPPTSDLTAFIPVRQPGKNNAVRIEIPDWTPDSLNAAMGQYWSKAYSLKRAAAQLLGVYAYKAGARFVDYAYRPVRRVSFASWHKGTLPDPDNLLKLTLDAMKAARLIVDDSDEWCKWEKPKVYACSDLANVLVHFGESYNTRDHEHTWIALEDVSLGPVMIPSDDPVLKRYLSQLNRKHKEGGR